MHCLQRGLPYEDKTSRGAMIVLITDDAEYRAAQQSTTSEPQTMSPETDRYRMDVEDEPRTPPTMQTGSSSVLPKAKTKAKGRGRA